MTREDPAQATQNAAKAQHQAWTDPVYRVSSKRNQTGLEQNEETEEPLDRREGDMHVGLHGFGEKGPGVLQIRDRHLGDNAGNQRGPPIDNTGRVNQGSCGRGHRQASMTISCTSTEVLQKSQSPICLRPRPAECAVQSKVPANTSNSRARDTPPQLCRTEPVWRSSAFAHRFLYQSDRYQH